MTLNLNYDTQLSYHATFSQTCLSHKAVIIILLYSPFRFNENRMIFIPVCHKDRTPLTTHEFQITQTVLPT
jgi:hypothetical protein